MTTQSALGPFMTPILTLTAKGQYAANVLNLPQAKVVCSLLFVQLLAEIPRTKPVGSAGPSDRVLRWGGAQDMSGRFVSFTSLQIEGDTAISKLAWPAAS